MHMGLATLTVASGTVLTVRCMAASGQTITEKVTLPTCLPSHLHCLLPLGSLVAFHSQHVVVNHSSHTFLKYNLNAALIKLLQIQTHACEAIVHLLSYFAGHWSDVS